MTLTPEQHETTQKKRRVDAGVLADFAVRTGYDLTYGDEREDAEWSLDEYRHRYPEDYAADRARIASILSFTDEVRR